MRTNRYVLIKGSEECNLACVFDLFAGKAFTTQFATWFYALQHVYEEGK